MSTESQPRCTAAHASASMARAEKTVSRQPRLPQEQMAPCGLDGEVTEVAGHAGVAAQQAAVDQRRAADTVAQGQHEDVLAPARRAPHDLAGQGDACVVIGEYRHFQRQADDIHDAQSLQVVQRAAQAFDARGVGVDQAFTAHAHSGGKGRALHQPADGVLQRRQEACPDRAESGWCAMRGSRPLRPPSRRGSDYRRYRCLVPTEASRLFIHC